MRIKSRKDTKAISRFDGHYSCQDKSVMGLVTALLLYALLLSCVLLSGGIISLLLHPLRITRHLMQISCITGIVYMSMVGTFWISQLGNFDEREPE